MFDLAKDRTKSDVTADPHLHGLRTEIAFSRRLFNCHILIYILVDNFSIR